ncbi:MAG: glycosyltransferase, partial [Acidobacteriota bacterium]
MRHPHRPIVVHVLTRAVLGGPTRPVLSLLERLSARGFRTVLITGIPERYEAEAREMLAGYPDLPVLRLPCLVRRPSPLHDARALAALLGAIRRLGPVIVHTHTAKAGALGRVATRLVGGRQARAIHTFHGHSLDPAVAGHRASLWRLAERMLARRSSDLIIALSPGQRRELCGLLGRQAADRMHVVPLGYDFARRSGLPGTAPAVASSRPHGGRLLAFIGRGVPVKGLDVLAAAHARLQHRDPSQAQRLRVVVAG